MELSEAARSTAGVLLLSITAIEIGGLYLLAVVPRRTALTPFQRAFARAGHGHAGVLVTLGLAIQPLADAAVLDGPLAIAARSGIPLAAILMSAGFFLSSTGKGTTRPNRLVALVYLGAVSLALGAVSLGFGLVTG